jgi:hypothetical protein
MIKYKIKYRHLLKDVYIICDQNIVINAVATLPMMDDTFGPFLLASQTFFTGTPRTMHNSILYQMQTTLLVLD